LLGIRIFIIYFIYLLGIRIFIIYFIYLLGIRIFIIYFLNDLSKSIRFSKTIEILTFYHSEVLQHFKGHLGLNLDSLTLSIYLI